MRGGQEAVRDSVAKGVVAMQWEAEVAALADQLLGPAGPFLQEREVQVRL